MWQTLITLLTMVALAAIVCLLFYKLMFRSSRTIQPIATEQPLWLYLVVAPCGALFLVMAILAQSIYSHQLERANVAADLALAKQQLERHASQISEPAKSAITDLIEQGDALSTNTLLSKSRGALRTLNTTNPSVVDTSLLESVSVFTEQQLWWKNTISSLHLPAGLLIVLSLLIALAGTALSYYHRLQGQRHRFDALCTGVPMLVCLLVLMDLDQIQPWLLA